MFSCLPAPSILFHESSILRARKLSRSLEVRSHPTPRQRPRFSSRRQRRAVAKSGDTKNARCICSTFGAASGASAGLDSLEISERIVRSEGRVAYICRLILMNRSRIYYSFLAISNASLFADIYLQSAVRSLGYKDPGSSGAQFVFRTS